MTMVSFAICINLDIIDIIVLEKKTIVTSKLCVGKNQRKSALMRAALLQKAGPLGKDKTRRQFCSHSEFV